MTFLAYCLRQGRVLFATTTTSTTTESTYAICWKASFSTVTGLYGCKRKRSTDRFTFRDDVPSHNEEIPQLSPTKSLTEDDISIDEVEYDTSFKNKHTKPSIPP